MNSHFLVLTIFAFFVSIGFALLMRQDPREQVKFGIYAFLCFVGSAVILGWLMYPFPS